MKVLVVEDDFASRKVLSKFLSPFAEVDVAVDGLEAVAAFTQAIEANEPYDLLCLDIMMPNMSGREALVEIRKIEEAHGIMGRNMAKIIMTTAADDSRSILDSFKEGCESYLTKPIEKEKLMAELKKLGLQ